MVPLLRRSGDGKDGATDALSSLRRRGQLLRSSGPATAKGGATCVLLLLRQRGSRTAKSVSWRRTAIEPPHATLCSRFQASFIVAASIVGLSCPGREIIETFISYLSKIVILEQYIKVQILTPCSLLFAKWNLIRQKLQNRLQIFCRQIFCSQETLKFTKQPSASLH